MDQVKVLLEPVLKAAKAAAPMVRTASLESTISVEEARAAATILGRFITDAERLFGASEPMSSRAAIPPEKLNSSNDE